MVKLMDPRPTAMHRVSLAWEARLRALFDSSFRRYVRVLHGPPTRERVGGKLPLVAIHLFDIQLTEYARTGKRPRAGGRQRGLRLEYCFSAWAEEALDEQLLLDHIRFDLDANRNLSVENDGHPAHNCPVTPKPSLKLENAISFWSAIGSPTRASLHYSVTVGPQLKIGKKP
jgi:hypothetical protein